MMDKLSLGMSARKRIGNTVYHVFMLLLSFIMIYPFVWSLLSSFKQSSQLYGGNPLDMIPRPFTLENYTRLFEVLPFERFLINLVIEIRRKLQRIQKPIHSIGVVLSAHFVHFHEILECAGRFAVSILLKILVKIGLNFRR